MVQYKSHAFASLALLVNPSSAFQVPRQNGFIAPHRQLYSTVVEKPVEVANEPLTGVTTQPRAEKALVNNSPTFPKLDLAKVSSILTPAEGFDALVDKGAYNAKSSTERLLVTSVLGGCYVGMGAMVSLAVAGNSAGLAEADPGLQKFVFAALFPMNLLLVQQCGGMLYTGNTASMMAAVCEKRVTWNDMGRVLLLSWIGNLFGCGVFAIACKYAGVIEGGAGVMAAKTLYAKTSADLAPVMIKAFFCNWLVCLAVVLSTQAKDMWGKYIAIWLPVSTFVSIGFEHSVANMFLLPAGLMSQDTITVGQAVTKNLIPVTIGNGLSGALLVGATFSYMFGTLGKPSESCATTAEPKTVDEVVSSWSSTASDTLGNVGQGLNVLLGATTTALASANIDEELSTPTALEPKMKAEVAASTERMAEPTMATLSVNPEPVPAALFIDTAAESVAETVKVSVKPAEAQAAEDSEKMVMEAQREAEEAKLLLLKVEAEVARLQAELAKAAEAEAARLEAESAKVAEAKVARLEADLAEAATSFYEEAEEVELDIKPVAVMAITPAKAMVAEVTIPAATTAVSDAPKPGAPVTLSATRTGKDVEQAPAATVLAAPQASASLSTIVSSIPPVSRVSRSSNLQDLLK